MENDECCAEKFQLSGNKTNLIIGTAAVILGVITVALISYFVYLRRRRAKVEYPDSVPIENLLSAKPAVEYYDSNRELSHTPSIVDSGISKKSDSRITTDSAADYSNSEMIIDTFKSPISIDALPDSSYKIKVLHKYDAIMPDELNLVVGDVLYLAHSFKDGWAYGINANSKLQGVFPKVCVASILTVDTTKPVVGAAIESPVDDSFTKRLSSLNVIGPQRSSLQVHSNTISDERTRVPFNQYLAQLDEVEAEDTKNE